MRSDHPPLSPRDAWLVGRALAGLRDRTEAERCSPRIRPVLARIYEVPPDEQTGIWQEHLEGLADDVAKDYMDAVAQVDPNGLPPDDESWEQPDLDRPVPVKPFPLRVFPHPAAEIVRQAAESIGCPIDFLAMTALAVGGAAVGRSVSLRVKEGYEENGGFYVANVGHPGDGKSPAVKKIVRPLRKIDEDAHKRHQERLKKFERDRADFEQAKKLHNKINAACRKRATGDADDPLDGLDDDADQTNPLPDPEPPVRPVQHRSVVNDVTTERLAAILSENPRGVLMYRDELTALIGSMNQYKSGKGTDRQFYLSAWSGETITVDRKSNPNSEPLRVSRPFLGIVGGMTPDMLGELVEAKGRRDGFLDRFLFAYPDPLPRPEWSEKGVPMEVAETWEAVVGKLSRRRMNDGADGPYPITIGFTPDAGTAWAQWINSHRDEMNADDFPTWLRGPWSKLEQYAARIVLTLHMLEWAADLMKEDRYIPDVEPRTIADAALLVDYLKSHSRRVYAALGGMSSGRHGDDPIQAILNWIRRQQPESFAERDVKRVFPRLAEQPKALQAALAWLEERYCIRRLPDPEKPPGCRGRKPSPCYAVNPRLVPHLEGRASSSPTAGPEPDLSDSTAETEPGPISGNSVHFAEELSDWGEMCDADSPV